MAVFNPNVQAGQDNSPNYFKFSEPISQPKADTSTGLALNTLGEGIEGATKLADTTVKDKIKSDVYAAVDPARDQQTAALEAIRTGQQNGVIPAPVQTSSGSTAGLSLTDDASSSAPVPAAIDIGLGKAGAVQDALHNGKINDTYYTQRLNSIAKDLRTNYPGYREYIDQRISEVTGVNPANAYMQNLMQDINRQGAAKDTEFNKTETRINRAIDDHVPGAVEVGQAWRQRNPNMTQDKVNEFLYGSQSEKSALDLAQARRAAANGNREDIKTQSTQDFTNEVGSTISTNFHAMVTIPGVDTPQGITDFMKAVAAHPEQYSATQLRSLDSQIMAQKSVVANQLAARAAQTYKDNQGRTYSYNSDIGTDVVQKSIKDQLSVYDNIHEALLGGGPQGAGLAFWHANQVAARFAQRENDISLSPLGKTVDTFKILNQDLGPAFAGVLAPKLINSPAMGQLSDLFNQSATEARAQPDFDKTGKPLTYMDHVNEVNKLAATGKVNDSMKARYQQGLIKIGEDIQDPNMPDTTKKKVVDYLFSPEGQGLLGTFKTDYTNADGKFVPGKYKVFNALTSDGMVENIAKLSKTDPSVGQKYKNYLENEAGSQLFYKELQTLGHYTGHDDLHFQYNNGDNGGVPFITLIDKSGKPVVTRQPTPGSWNTAAPSQDPEYLFRVNESVGRINSALAGLGRVEKGLGGDVNAYVLNFLQHAQVNLGQNFSGLPSKLADAIAASRTPQKRIDEVFKGLR